MTMMRHGGEDKTGSEKVEGVGTHLVEGGFLRLASGGRAHDDDVFVESKKGSPRRLLRLISLSATALQRGHDKGVEPIKMNRAKGTSFGV
jgi:hypothetical protein